MSIDFYSKSKLKKFKNISITQMETDIMFLLKFGKKEHLEDLSNGILYMNDLNFFINYEKNDIIGDNNEGLMKLHQPSSEKEMILNMVGTKTHDPNYPEFVFGKNTNNYKPNHNHEIVRIELNNPIITRPTNIENVNIFSMFAYRYSHFEYHKRKIIYDDKLTEFEGQYVLLIHKVNEFFSKIKNSLEKEKILYHFDLVKYVDENSYAGEMGVFKKYNKYMYQSEFRIACNPTNLKRGKNNEFILNIGSIKDLLSLYPIDFLRKEKIRIKED